MNKKSLFVIFICSTHCLGQNVVPNSGFESVTCVSDITTNTINFTDSWFDTEETQSIDVYHACFEDEFFTPPYNISGYSLPFKGDGMAGFIPMMVSEESTTREVLSVRLLDDLIKDSTYCVTFWIKNSYYFDYEYATDNIGVLFSVDTLKESDVLSKAADIRCKKGRLLSENEWVEVSGLYKANGAEKYLNLGFFGSRLETDWYFNGPDFLPNGLPAHLYYFVDNIEVISCEEDSIKKMILEVPNIFTPNGDTNNDYLTIKHQNIEELEMIILNRWGQQIITFDPRLHPWDGNTASSQVSDGVYFYVIRGTDIYGEPIEKYGHITVVR